jgi:hypothetical protein
MRRDGTRKHGIRPALLPTVVTLVLLMAAGAGAQDMDPNDRYTLAGKAIAPKVAQSLTWGIVDTVSSRVDTVGSLQATMERLEASGIVQYGLPKLSHRMLISYDGTPLLIGETGQVNGAQGTLWGFGFTTGGDYRSLGSGPDAEVDWDGEVISGHLGFDVRPVREMLVGLTAGVSQASTRFEIEVDGQSQRGLLDHRMITASPYFSWVLFPGMWWWATATYGVGEATMADREEPGVAHPHAGSSSLLSGAIGWNVNVIDSPGYDPGSRVGVAVRGEGSLNQFRVERTQGDMPDLEMNTWRGRVMVQGTYEQPVNDSVYLIPSLEAGVRYDGGQAASGAGVELGGRFRYEDQSVGLALEAHGRALVPLEGPAREWTGGGLVRISSDRDGFGPFLNVTPSYDRVESIAEVPTAKLVSRQGRLDAELGYDGLQMDGVPGLLTPYGAVTLADGGTSTYRWGSRLALTDDLDLNLEAQHERANIAAETEHSATLSANLRL